ncbi:hypothetical protein J2X31_002533 [Flavobacterium arsenatis]|uniref:RES domain-containing protein n=1 Tax=Flavobacterium arsenatis TaxID=1484332 RepID=A0ABU1TRL4_9FLAO|nr:hypothetical protein [Flavobacterium arsenatis]MDR6968510.1 hypothetical protein [Flavobacterium arsenatis]
MEFNNLASIVSCLKEWDTIRDNSFEVTEFLNLGNYFSFTRNKPETSAIHAYPGICAADKEFYMFLIDAEADQKSSESDLFNAITICKVKRNMGNSDEIPEAEALKRIDTWKRDCSAWATEQINNRQQTQGIFQAFNVPSSYMQKDVEYSTFFALKQEGLGSYSADLVTVDRSKSSIAFYDTVRPVPPFDVTPRSNFYLLDLL